MMAMASETALISAERVFWRSCHSESETEQRFFRSSRNAWSAFRPVVVSVRSSFASAFLELVFARSCSLLAIKSRPAWISSVFADFNCAKVSSAFFSSAVAFDMLLSKVSFICLRIPTISPMFFVLIASAPPAWTNCSTRPLSFGSRIWFSKSSWSSKSFFTIFLASRKADGKPDDTWRKD